MSAITITSSSSGAGPVPTVRVEPTRLGKIVGLLPTQEVPISAITAVVVDPDPLRGMRGLRSPGLAMPGRTKIGTWRGNGRRQYVIARRGQPAVRIDVEGQRYDSFLISVPDARATVVEIETAIEALRAQRDPRTEG